MKVRTGALLALGLALVASPGYAQGVTYGAKIGVNFADVSVSGDTEDATDMKTGLVVGGFADASITPQFSIQPEVLFSMKGAKAKDSDPEVSTNVNLIEIPVLAKYKFASKSSAKPFVVAGPGFGFVASAKTKIDGVDGDIDIKDSLETVDVSFIIGGGVDINNLSVEARYDFGLRDTFKDNPTDITSKSRTLSFLVGYSFGKK
jgi:hypothetical protein